MARALVTIPWAAPPVAVALIFTWMFNAQYGIFNHALRALGLAAGARELARQSVARAAGDPDHDDLADLSRSRRLSFSRRCRACPSELRDAAVIDGADRLSVFQAVVWPTIQPSVMLLALFITIWSLRRFDLIWLMTQGGPIGATNTLVIELYRQGFVYRDLGQAAAVGMVGLCDRARRHAGLLPADAARRAREGATLMTRSRSGVTACGCSRSWRCSARPPSRCTGCS